MSQSAPRDWTLGQAGIVAYRCLACDEAFYFERGFCPCCGGRDIAREQSGGSGIVLARTVVHRAPREAWRGTLPYALVLVRLEEGFTVMGHGHPALCIGNRVRADFIAFGGSPVVPFFLPQDDRT